MEISNSILSDITVYMKYARYLEDKQRRENWTELVTRNMEMHVKKYPHLEGEIRENYKFVFEKKVNQIQLFSALLFDNQLNLDSFIK